MRYHDRQWKDLPASRALLQLDVFGLLLAQLTQSSPWGDEFQLWPYLATIATALSNFSVFLEPTHTNLHL